MRDARSQADKMSLQRCIPGMIASAFVLVVPAAIDAAASEAKAGNMGMATWYGARHEGHRTSSGAVFHQDGLTAASKTLPLGSKVRVTLHETGSSVVVLVNDRMGGRALIDLSRGAAQQIGLYARGRGAVTVEPADEPVEVAEASEDEAADIVSSAPRGRRHTPHGAQSGAAAPPCYPAPSVVLARHSAQPRAARHTL